LSNRIEFLTATCRAIEIEKTLDTALMLEDEQKQIQNNLLAMFFSHTNQSKVLKTNFKFQ